MKTFILSSINPKNSHNNGNTLLSFFDKDKNYKYIYLRNDSNSKNIFNNKLKFGNLKSLLNLVYFPSLIIRFPIFNNKINKSDKVFFLVGDNISLMIYLLLFYKKKVRLSLYFTDNYFYNNNKFSNFFLYLFLKRIFKLNPDLYFINVKLKKSYSDIFINYFPRNTFILNYNYLKPQSTYVKSIHSTLNTIKTHNPKSVNIIYVGGLGIGRDSELLNLIQANFNTNLHFHVITTSKTNLHTELIKLPNLHLYLNLKINEIAYFYEKADFFLHLENDDFYYVYKESLSTKLFEYLVYEKPIFLSIPQNTYTYDFLENMVIYISKPYDSNKILDLLNKTNTQKIQIFIQEFNKKQRAIHEKILKRINY